MGFGSERFFENKEKRNAIGLIAIHVDDLLISGNGPFLKYMGNGRKSEVGSFEENGAAYLGMRAIKTK